MSKTESLQDFVAKRVTRKPAEIFDLAVKAGYKQPSGKPLNIASIYTLRWRALNPEAWRAAAKTAMKNYRDKVKNGGVPVKRVAKKKVAKKKAAKKVAKKKATKTS